MRREVGRVPHAAELGQEAVQGDVLRVPSKQIHNAGCSKDRGGGRAGVREPGIQNTGDRIQEKNRGNLPDVGGTAQEHTPRLLPEVKGTIEPYALSDPARGLRPSAGLYRSAEDQPVQRAG